MDGGDERRPRVAPMHEAAPQPGRGEIEQLEQFTQLVPVPCPTGR